MFNRKKTYRSLASAALGLPYKENPKKPTLFRTKVKQFIKSILDFDERIIEARKKIKKINKQRKKVLGNIKPKSEMEKRVERLENIILQNIHLFK